MTPRYAVDFTCWDLLRALVPPCSDQSLEAGLASQFQTKHALLLASCRAALNALLRVCERKGEVVVPAYTCLSVPLAVQAAGFQPVFADVGPDSFNMTVDTLLRVLSPRTAAVVITHQFGLPCDVYPMLELCRQRGLLAIEDVAPAFGATLDGIPVGRFGEATVASFGLTKVVPTGRGGAFLTSNDDLFLRTCQLRGYDTASPCPDSGRALCRAAAWKLGCTPVLYPALLFLRSLMKRTRLYQVVPAERFFVSRYRYRPAPAVSALFSFQLRNLKWNLERRRHLAGIYASELRGIHGLVLPHVIGNAAPSWTQYPVFVPDKTSCYHFMLSRSIDLSWTYRYSVAESYRDSSCPNAAYAAQHLVGLPTFPSLPDAAAYRICGLLREHLAAQRSKPRPEPVAQEIAPAHRS